MFRDAIEPDTHQFVPDEPPLAPRVATDSRGARGGRAHQWSRRRVPPPNLPLGEPPLVFPPPPLDRPPFAGTPPAPASFESSSSSSGALEAQAEIETNTEASNKEHRKKGYFTRP
jgi:hypothetical protein